jgi:3-dehydroquinate synthase
MVSAIKVNLPQQSYDIAIAPGSLDQLGDRMATLKLGKKVLLVSNPNVFQFYGERAIASLKAAGFEVASYILPDGENYKTLESVQKIYDAALENRLERSATMVALGGGVIGDMTGFAAATWLRGINFVQVPTTLLAMVDAAIGGKTGVNHPQGKNLIGAFHQPRLVLIDPEVLKTLPVRELRAGMAEVIKYGVIWDAQLFDELEASQRLDEMEYLIPPTPLNKEGYNSPTPLGKGGEGGSSLMDSILTRSCQAKADVVSKDEKEAGLRAILNYGHTIGHAVESLTGYTQVLHGEAVAIGMVAAGQIAVELGMWTQEETQRQDSLIQKAGLPTQLPSGLDIEAIIEALKIDKKVKAGKVRFVLPTQIGVVTVTDQVPADIIRQVLRGM